MSEITDISREPFENHYVIQKELGRGKFATVYQCEKHTTKELFAAKIIQTKSQKNMEESLNEVEILRSVDHIGIVKCYDVFQSKNSLTMILELIGGGELFEKLANEDHVSEGQAASYTKQVLEALQHLHSLKIAHLDLKPENLMLSAVDSDVIKIVDFGLSKRLNKRVVCMQGTPEFVPPEVISLDPLGAYSDMWSVGVIVYIMVSGYSPFMGDDDNQTYGNISMCDYEFYEEEFANISEDCKDFIKNLLLIKTSERLAATTALNHNWIVNRSQNKNAIEHQKLKRFLAQRKWRALQKTIQSARMFNSLLGSKKHQESITPPSVAMDHRKLMVAPGDSISITAHIVSVKPSCSWSKDGTLLTVDKQKICVIESDTQSILIVSQFTAQDEGHYTVACSNPSGAVATATIQLITLAPTAPCVSFEKREYVTTEGETVKLIADIVSEPKPTVVWENKSKRDVAKSKSRFTQVEDKCYAELTITKVKIADAGNYTIKARNKLGRGAASVQLKVLPRKDTAERSNSIASEGSPTDVQPPIKSSDSVKSKAEVEGPAEAVKPDAMADEAKAKVNPAPVTAKTSPLPVSKPSEPKSEQPISKPEEVKTKPPVDQSSKSVESVPAKANTEPPKPKEISKEEPPKPTPSPTPKAAPQPTKPEPKIEPVKPKETPKPNVEPPKPIKDPPKPEKEPVKPKEEPKEEPPKPKEKPMPKEELPKTKEEPPKAKIVPKEVPKDEPKTTKEPQKSVPVPSQPVNDTPKPTAETLKPKAEPKKSSSPKAAKTPSAAEVKAGEKISDTVIQANGQTDKPLKVSEPEKGNQAQKPKVDGAKADEKPAALKAQKKDSHSKLFGKPIKPAMINIGLPKSKSSKEKAENPASDGTSAASSPKLDSKKKSDLINKKVLPPMIDLGTGKVKSKSQTPKSSSRKNSIDPEKAPANGPSSSEDENAKKDCKVM